MRSLVVASAFIAVTSFFNPVIASHDPTTVNPPLDVISTDPYAWPTLDNSPIAASYQCHTGRPGFAPNAASLRRAADTLNTTHTGNCFPRKPPGCHLLAIDEYARISFCATSEDGNGYGGKPEDPKEVKNLCTTLNEVAHVFIARCFRRGLSGGFVRIDEGKFAGDIIALWADFTDRPPLPAPAPDAAAADDGA